MGSAVQIDLGPFRRRGGRSVRGATPTSPFRAPGRAISEVREFAPHFLNSDASPLSVLDMAPASRSRPVPESVISEVREDRDHNRRLI